MRHTALEAGSEAGSKYILTYIWIVKGQKQPALVTKQRKSLSREHSHCRHVLAVKLHYGVKWSKDLVLFLHSVAHELSAAGMHMYLLVQVGCALLPFCGLNHQQVVECTLDLGCR